MRVYRATCACTEPYEAALRLKNALGFRAWQAHFYASRVLAAVLSWEGEA